MHRVISIRNAWVAIAALLFGAWTAEAQTHGSHSTHERGSEGSDVPTATDVADAVEDYIRHDTKLKGGYFLIFDSVHQIPLVLTLDRVREDGLRMVDDHEYFACADFKSADGETYDLDIFMKGSDKAQLEVAAIRVHKENGTLRYDWSERDGIWTKRQIARSDRNP